MVPGGNPQNGQVEGVEPPGSEGFANPELLQAELVHVENWKIIIMQLGN